MTSGKQRERFEYLCETIKRISGIDPLRDSRKRDNVTVRSMVAWQLIQEGFTTIAVGELFGKNHSTIIHYKDRFLGFFMPGWEAERELWEKFKQEI